MLPLFYLMIVCVITTHCLDHISTINSTTATPNHANHHGNYTDVRLIDLALQSTLPHNELRDILQRLRQYPFYRIFAVNLYSECMYWNDQHQCAEIGCAVCGECSSDELPVEWINELSAHTSIVNDTISHSIQAWSDTERQLWIYQDNSTINEIKYIDLSYNPEGMYSNTDTSGVWL